MILSSRKRCCAVVRVRCPWVCWSEMFFVHRNVAPIGGNVWQLKVVPPSVKLNVRKSAESYKTEMSGIIFRCCYHQLRLSWLIHANTFVQRPQNVSAREMSLENEKQKRIPSRKFVRENRAKNCAKDLKTCQFVTASKRPMKKWKYVRADFLKSLNVWGDQIFLWMNVRREKCPAVK